YEESSESDTVFDDYGYTSTTSTVVSYPDANGSKSPSENIVGDIWYSSNAGGNWTKQKSSTNFTSLAATVFGTRTILFAARAGGSYASVWKSYDLGVHWDNVSNNSLNSLEVTHIRSIVVKAGDTMTVLAVTDKGVIKSTNSAADWSFANNSTWTTNEKNMFKIIADPGNNSTFYISTYSSVWKTTNTGNSWTSIKTGTQKLNTSSVAPYNSASFLHGTSQTHSGIGTYANSAWDFSPVIASNHFIGRYIALDPRSIISGNPEYAYACGDTSMDAHIFVRSSTDGEWDKKFSQYAKSSTFYQVVPDPKRNSSLVYAVGYRGSYNLFISDDKGASWSNKKVRHDGKYPALCVAIDTVALYTGGNNDYSKRIYVGLGKANGIGGGIVRVNNVDSLSDTLNRLDGKPISSIAINTKTTTLSATIYAGGDSGIYKSTDTGHTFTRVSTLKAKRLLMNPSIPNSTNYIYMINSTGDSLYQTINGGTVWTTISTSGVPKPINDLRRDPSNNTLIYLATSAGVYRIDPAPEIPANVAKIIPESAHPKFTWDANAEDDMKEYQVFKQLSGSPYLIATVSTTSYEDLEEYNDGEQEATYTVKAVDNGNNVSTSSGGVTFNVAGGGQAKIRIGTLHDIPKEFALEQNFPNPFNPATKIKFALPVDANVSLKIFDVNGKEIATLVNGVKQAGYYEVPFDARKLASGVYIYKLTAGNFSETKKMLLMK
ncbi:MAG: T9SS type A sorting domain-containing protein, partial [Bacteroidota bacterium]